MLALLKLVPTSVWLGLGAFIAAAAAFFWIDHQGYERGAEAVRVEWTKERWAMQEALDREKLRQAQVVETVVVEYRDRVKVIKEKGDAIVTLVPHYVRTSCVLPGGWRVLHDAAATGSVPQDPDGAISSAEGVDAATALGTVASNYAGCRAEAQKLVALQQLVKGLANERP